MSSKFVCLGPLPFFQEQGEKANGRLERPIGSSVTNCRPKRERAKFEPRLWTSNCAKNQLLSLIMQSILGLRIRLAGRRSLRAVNLLLFSARAATRERRASLPFCPLCVRHFAIHKRNRKLPLGAPK